MKVVMKCLPKMALAAALLFAFSNLKSQKAEKVTFGLCTDVHIPTMHDPDYRLNQFISSMKKIRPDFIIELGDFGTPDEKYRDFFEIWNSFPGEKYHVIGNHEMDGGFTLEQALSNLGMTSPYYSFDRNGFHFIALNGNESKNKDVKGYKQFIGPEQMKWLTEELAVAIYPVVIFSHQGLSLYKGPDEDYGVENYREVQDLLEKHNAEKQSARVIACFNGHSHADCAENINGIWYITITSMSYHWLGEKYMHLRYSEEVDKGFKWLKFTAPFREPLYTVVEISKEGFIAIKGKTTDWVGPSPFELGYPAQYGKYLKPAITERKLTFSQKQ